jgi:hypothetical protein
VDDAKVSRPLVSRRTTLRAAAVGASAVWIAPLVQVVSMDSAIAASGAPAPREWKGREWRGENPPRGPGNNRGIGKGS